MALIALCRVYNVESLKLVELCNSYCHNASTLFYLYITLFCKNLRWHKSIVMHWLWKAIEMGKFQVLCKLSITLESFVIIDSVFGLTLHNPSSRPKWSWWLSRSTPTRPKQECATSSLSHMKGSVWRISPQTTSGKIPIYCQAVKAKKWHLGWNDKKNKKLTKDWAEGSVKGSCSDCNVYSVNTHIDCSLVQRFLEAKWPKGHHE